MRGGTKMDVGRLFNDGLLVPYPRFILGFHVRASHSCLLSVRALFAFVFERHKRDCVGAITLGKDMVFRDYAQGAYRLRGPVGPVGSGRRLARPKHPGSFLRLWGGW